MAIHPAQNIWCNIPDERICAIGAYDVLDPEKTVPFSLIFEQLTRSLLWRWCRPCAMG
jgi:hypothetical protein